MTAFATGRLEANGLTFHYLEAGQGPLVLCLHGFPDNAHTYDALLPVLAGAGFHAVAPFMRGYAPTSPAPDERYQAVLLAQDAVALLAALGGGRGFLVGHDWRSPPSASRGWSRWEPPILPPRAGGWPRATSGTRASGTPTSSSCRSPSRSWRPTTSRFSRTGGATRARACRRSCCRRTLVRRGCRRSKS